MMPCHREEGKLGEIVMEWMLMPYRRYAEFSGRSQRKEYWMFILLMVIIEIVLFIPLLAAGFSLFSSLGAGAGAASPALGAAAFGPVIWIVGLIFLVWGLATIIPALAVTVRRLHDRDMSGWYLAGFIVVAGVLSRLGSIGSLLTFVLEIGWIVLLALPGTPGTNKYGPDPLGHVDPEVFA
jgi:uncharacterized membrane protein YhaH (DUF805 family)